MKLTKTDMNLLIFFISYSLWIILFNDFNQAFMIWNLMLAYFAYILANCIYKNYVKEEGKNISKVKSIVLWLGWILFYPNAPYMATDLMHLSNSKFYIKAVDPISNNVIYKFSTDLLMWKRFFTLFVGSMLGIALSAIILNKIHHVFINKFGARKAWVLIIIINYISGFAIFLGRFSRYNSWDLILKPYNIIRIITEEVHYNGIMFTIMFGTISLLGYLFFNLMIVQYKEMNKKVVD